MITFENELASVSLVPGTGGVFEVRVDGICVASRAMDGGFIELKQLKQRVRDRVAPEKPLGHSERR